MVACAGVLVWVRALVGGRATARWCFCGPHRLPGWPVLGPLGCRLALCRGRRMVPRGRCAGCCRSLGTGALRGLTDVGVHGAKGPGVGGVGRGSGTCLCRVTCVLRACGALRRPVWCAEASAGLRPGLCCRCLEAAGWQPRVDASGGVFLSGACGAWGWANLRVCGAEGLFGLGAYCPRQVKPDVPGSLWLRGVVARVVLPPVWMHVLVGGSVACPSRMVPEQP